MEMYEILEKEWSEWCGFPQGNSVACSSGTSGLHIGLETLQLPLGAKVAIPDFTMVACARAASLAGLSQIFIDCKDDLNISVDCLIEAAQTQNLVAVMAVHTYGRRCDMDKIVDIAKTHKLAVIEDISEAHGVIPHPMTDVSVWSCYKGKIVRGEEGGMIAFKDPEKASLARKLRSLGFTDAHDFNHLPRGVNARMSNVHARLILRSFAYVQENLADRKLIEGWYDERCPKEWQMPARDSVWVYDVRIPGMTCAQQTTIVQQLNAQGIAARHAFQPMTSQAEFLAEVDHPNAYRAAREVLYLPVQPLMTQDQVQGNMDALVKAVESVMSPAPV